jgi:hypothetical protein
VPEAQPEGEPRVRSGLSLCTLHHAAFDRAFVGLRPDDVIAVRPDNLREDDGPTLVHAFRALHGTRTLLPTARAHRRVPGLVEQCYAQFRLRERRARFVQLTPCDSAGRIGGRRAGRPVRARLRGAATQRSGEM